MPRLAVVIPSYNHAHYIKRALDSCINQTRRPDRIVVIDDGSKDDSLAVIRAYEKDGVELTAQENAGAHTTINRAIAMAAKDCDLISILNSDDHYEPTRFEKCLPLFERDPKTSVVCTGLNIIGSDDELLDENEARSKWFRAVWSIGDDPNIELAEWMGRANFPATTTNVIARADYLLANPFRPYRFNHDYFFLAKATIEGRLRLLREPLANYRVHATNTITTAPAPLIREMLRMHLDLYADMADDLENDAELRRQFFLYMAAAQENVSSFHPGLFQTLLARIAATTDSDSRENLASSLGDELPEMQSFPNKAIVNTHDGKTPITNTSSLAQKYEELRAERTQLKVDAAAQKALAKLRLHLLNSRWCAFGKAIGFAKGLDTDSGKIPTEKLASLETAIKNSPWASLGQKLGVFKLKTEN
jgi:glycosyltransferase involved in cell wall biosynthesis